LMHMNLDSMRFPESICTPESKSIRGRGERHKLQLFWNPNVTGVKCNSVSFLSAIPKQQNRTHVPFV
jgi:hypothetical protein